LLVKHFKKIVVIAVGATLGFAYYRFIGCQSGVCPLTSNPWISTGYGALIGFVFTLNGKQKEQKDNQEKESN
jgi:hypothetical protein